MKPKSKITDEDVREMYKEAGSYFPGMYNVPVDPDLLLRNDPSHYRLLLANLGIWLTVCPRCRTTSIHKISEKKQEPELITAEWDPKKYLEEVKPKASLMRFKCTICGGTFEVREVEPKTNE